MHYERPIHPEVHRDGPGACPICGMALEAEIPAGPATRTEKPGPMHSGIVRDGPGSCPVCGMAIEPRTITLEEEENPDLKDMSIRFWVSLALTVP